MLSWSQHDLVIHEYENILTVHLTKHADVHIDTT